MEDNRKSKVVVEMSVYDAHAIVNLNDLPSIYILKVNYIKQCYNMDHSFP